MVTLYHGTSSRYLEAILREGLRPRSVTGVRNHWKEFPSRPGLVYLTSAYPVYFAVTAADEGGVPVILKVEVNEEALYPDEDYLVILAAEQSGEELSEIHHLFDPTEYKEMWNLSLGHAGLACTPEIKADAILDHRVLGNPRLMELSGADAVPNYINYAVMGTHYEKCLDLIFSKGEDEALKAVEGIFDEDGVPLERP